MITENLKEVGIKWRIMG